MKLVLNPTIESIFVELNALETVFEKLATVVGAGRGTAFP